ncbi:hypothetical protein [Pseudomonas bohemica]|uniref:hypothetical protein n=1 Tax=Pseudomonas bohemica TaxID=2044872 RepID=UPI000DA5EC7C|nr:hypothetical protein [Pseudomonas bohemica]
MNSLYIDALKYVRNTGEEASLAHFRETYEQVSPQLWNQLVAAGLVSIDSAGKIWLTAAGVEALAASNVKAATRPSKPFKTSGIYTSFDSATQPNSPNLFSSSHNGYGSEPHRSTDHCSSYSSSDYSSSDSFSDSCSSSSDSSFSD